MAYEAILYEKRGKIAFITLNRPVKLNAVSPTMARELDEALDDFDLDDDAWVAIISGNGRCFSAGADLTVFASTLEGDPRTRSLGSFASSRKAGGYLESQNWKPVIAAVHGYCYGIALGLALQCDIIVATEDAKFRIAEVQRGIGGGAFGVEMTYLGCGRVGTELALTGRDLGGPEGYRLGFLNRLVTTQDELLPAAEEFAQQIMEAPPLAVRENVRLCRKARQMAMAPVRFLSSGRNLTATDDFEEATRAFVEKRKPVFKAR